MPDADTLARRRALVLDVLHCDNPAERLLHHLEALQDRQDTESQAAVFEAVVWRRDIAHFWIYYRMREVYGDLGRPDMVFLMAALTVRMNDREMPLQLAYRDLFRHHRNHDDPRSAVDAFLAHADILPERPVVDRWEVEPVTRAIGLSLDPPDGPAGPGARKDRLIHPAETFVPPCPPVLPAGRLPAELSHLGREHRRNEVSVAELPDAELFLRHDSAVVADRDGRLHTDLSLGPFPALLHKRVAGDNAAEQIQLDAAVLVLDPHPPPNLCHFLYDQMARLALFEAAGVDLSGATVIGPPLQTTYQKAVAGRVPMAGWLSTDRVARVRVKRLFVSTEARELQHPGHLCAPWAVGWIRRKLDAAAKPGTRKLYLSRADNSNRQATNEAAFLPLLQARGFQVIVPGRMDYEDQLQAFRDASHVIGVHGAALAHLSACAPGTRVLEMFHPLYGTWAYALLSQACALDYTALVGRDGVSDAPELNDPDIAGATYGRYGDRAIRVAPELLQTWLDRP